MRLRAEFLEQFRNLVCPVGSPLIPLAPKVPDNSNVGGIFQITSGKEGLYQIALFEGVNFEWRFAR